MLTRQGKNGTWNSPEFFITDKDLGMYGSAMSIEHLAGLFTEGVVNCTSSDLPDFKYRLYEPENKESGKKYPLVVYLHGVGERGSDNIRQFSHSLLVRRLLASQDKYPCYIFVPQCPESVRWINLVHELYNFTSDYVAASYNQVDKNNLIMTGLSMGAQGTWKMISTYPGIFQTAVPMHGGGFLDNILEAGKTGTRIWAFHGDEDIVIHVENGWPAVPGSVGTRKMIEKLRAAGYAPKYYEYPGVGHSWGESMAEKDLIDWIFKN